MSIYLFSQNKNIGRLIFKYSEKDITGSLFGFLDNKVDFSKIDEGTKKIESFAKEIQDIKKNKELSLDDKLSLFGDLKSQREDFNFDYLTEAAKDFDIINDKIEDFTDKASINLYEANLKNTRGFIGVKTAIEDYNQVSDTVGKNQMANAIEKTNSTLGKYLLNLDGAKASTAKYAGTLALATTKQIAFQAITATLNMGISMLASYALSKVISVISEIKQKATELAERNKQLAEQNKQAAEQYKEEYKSLADLYKQYTQISSQTSLSASDKEKLIDIQKELIDTYGVEADKLDLINGKYEDNLAIIDEAARKKAFRWEQNASNTLLNANKNVDDNKANVLGTYDIITATPGYNPFMKQSASKYNHSTPLQKALLSVEGFKNKLEDTRDEAGLTGGSTIKTDTYNIVLPNMSSKDKVAALTNAIEELDKHSNELNPNGDSEDYVTLHNKLADLLNHYQEEVTERDNAINSLANSKIQSFMSDKGVSYLNVAEDTYADYAQALIDQFRENNGDPEVEEAIINNLNSFFGGNFGTIADNDGKIVFNSIQEQLDKIKSQFDFTSFFEDEDINFDDTMSDIESLKTAYSNLVDGKDIDKVELFEKFPDLRAYADDTEKLRGKLNQIANTKSSELVNQLMEFLPEADSTTQKEIRNLIEIIQDASNLAGAETFDTETDPLEAKKAYYEDQIKSIEEVIENLNKEKEVQNGILSSLQDQKSELEDIISNYETASDTAISVIEDEISAIEEQKSAIEDKYNKEIEALQTENDERDRNIDLREKEIALDKAKNTKTRVYSASRGFTVQTDSEAVRKAQADYDNALNESKIDELEKQRDSETAIYDERIEEYENYKQAWEDVVSSYQNAQDELTTATVLGSDWRERILNKDSGVLNNFAGNYESYQNRLHNVIEPQITDVQNVITSLEKQITTQNNLKDNNQTLLDNLSESTTTYTDIVDKVVSDTDRLSVAADKAMSAWTKLLGGAAGSIIDNASSTIAPNFSNLWNQNWSGGSYANGGVVDYTGKADVHGSPSKPEVVFNSSEAKKLYNIVRNMSLNNTLPQLQNADISEITKKISDNISQTINTNSQVTNNSYQWVLTGNTIKADNYNEFKAYMDRYVREAQMNLIVGKQ